MPTTILVSVDIEKTGHMLAAHPVVSVGFVVGDTKGIIYDRLKINFQVAWPTDDCLGDFEERCWTEFWVKNPDAQKACKTNPDPIDRKEGWMKVAAFLDALETKFPAPEFKIKFLSDNASFDVGNIDYCLEKYAQRQPMRYSTDLKYRSIQDPTEQMRFVKEKDAINKAAAEKSPHNHDSLSDATHIFWQYVELYYVRLA